ncbi:Hypothetical protein TART1_0320 [Trichococcus shcherbakoviae]|uniref:Uncharacterized protein n=1 Tax=Trichococcus shcherbakoviae TaxID=2094020 RepID=A0A383TDJ6_9LACT|nr:Hypothetical protein TART1_0320 [Trichococcus shcherbakoviae]
MMKKNASTLKLCKNLFQINQTDIEMSVFFIEKSPAAREIVYGKNRFRAQSREILIIQKVILGY